jgi:hypothetical protein
MGVSRGWRSGFGEIPNSDLVASVFQEINPSPDTPSQFVIVRYTQEPIIVNLEPFDGAPS